MATDDINDPYQSSLIGQEFTLITTKYGDLEAKLLSTNPDFSALVVEYLGKLGLKKGDAIGLGITGSFPALNIAAIKAAEVFELNIVMISSVGSSGWGANDPFFTWLDMESVLFNSGVTGTSSQYSSVGGGEDIGRGLSPKGRELIKKSMKRNNIKSLKGMDIEDLIESRMKMFLEGKGKFNIKAYINVGGGMASIGNSSDSSEFPSGLIQKLPPKNFSVPGVMYKLLSKGIPVINLHNIKILANKVKIRDKYNPNEVKFTGPLYKKLKYNISLVVIFKIILIALIGIFALTERKEIYNAMKVTK